MHTQNIPELLQLFLEHTPVAVAMFDREMGYIAASRKWLTNNGYSESNLIGSCSCHCQVFPNFALEWKNIHDRCLTGLTERCEAQKLVQVDGTVDWLKWECCPWYGKDGEVGGTIFLTEVVTAVKDTEDKLQQAEAELQRYQEQLEDYKKTEEERQNFVSLVENSSDLLRSRHLMANFIYK
ncbi:MAG: PAS domain-containing protein [Methylacidiphilales bacterium]|nr:PAS domain-containing protein [Candidatus Methylacidiphilales bacterium]